MKYSLLKQALGSALQKAKTQTTIKYGWKLAIIIVFAIGMPFFIISCGQANKNAYLGGGGHGGWGGGYGLQGGTYLDEAIGYNMMEGHEIHLTFLSLQYGYHGGYQQNYSYGYQNTNYSGYGYHGGGNRRNGPVNITGFVTFGAGINNYTGGYDYIYGNGYGSGYGHGYGSGYGYGHGQGYGYGYDPCYIPAGQPLQLSLDAQAGPAMRQGNDFGEYELLAYGRSGEIIALSPINPSVGASFIGGHNLNQVYAHMEVMVARIDTVECQPHFVTFGARF